MRALRDEDGFLVTQLFEYIDKLSRFWEYVPDTPDAAQRALSAVRVLQSMISSLAKDLGIGPAARTAMGINTETKPGSRLKAFTGGAA